jgi:hypothetical protein
MCSHSGGIEKYETDIHISYFLKHEKHSSEHSGGYPSDVTGINRMPLTIFPRKLSPLTASCESIEHTFKSDLVREA